MGIDRIKLGPLPEIAGRFRGPLMIMGGGPSVWDDADSLSLQCDIMCVNDIGMYVPGVRHWYSHHADRLPGWAVVRAFHHKPVQHYHTVLAGKAQPGHHVWPFPSMGTSSLGACYTGLALGYDEIYLAGIPLDNSGHFFDPTPSNFVNEGRQDIWERARDEVFEGRVKSLSGRSKEILG